MSLEVLERWYSVLAEYEKDMPIIRLRSRTYTPKEILREVRAGTTLGMELQRIFESLRLNYIKDESLASERLLKYFREHPEGGLVALCLDERELSARALAEHVRRRDQIGISLITAEMEHMKDILKI